MKEIFLLLVAAVVWFLKNQSESAKGRSSPPARPAPAEAENVRQTREAVRRRIAARRGEGPGPRRPQISPDPAYKAEPPRQPFPAAPEPEASLFEIEEDRKVLAAQLKLEDQIQALEKEAAAVGTAAPKAKPPAALIAMSPSAPNGGTGYLPQPEFKDASDLRRAVVWKEILDKPLGLR